jgi:hypothetical protein
MENKESPDPQRHYVPRPTGNLFFYRPQNECNTPKEQAQLAAGPLSTPDSPSMVCSGASGIEEDEQDDGWSRHRPEQQQHEQQQQIVDAVQHKTKEHTFSQDFANFFIPPSLNNTSRQAVKKDTAALDLILKKAAVFLSPLPATKDNNETEEEREEEGVVAGSEGVVGIEEGKEKILPIIPRCLAFDEDARSIEKEEERAREPQLPPQRHADELERPKAQPAVSATISNNNSSSSALHRLKQKTLERQSSQVAALSKLKQLTALKQKNRIASSSIKPQYALPDEYTTSTTTSASIGEEVSCFETPMVVSLQKNVPVAGDIKRAGPLASAAYTTENRPQGTSDDSGTTATGKKPYLKRRSVAIPMQHQGVPDWSGVKPKTQSKLESNLILHRQKSGATTSHSSNASVARQGHQQQDRREYKTVPGGGSETMEQYTAALYNQQNSTNSTRGGSGNAQKVPVPSNGSKRDPWRSIRPSTQSAAAAGPLGQSKPSTLSSASTAHRHHHQQQHTNHPHQHRAEIRVAPSFNPNSIVSTPASRNAFGPLGAAAIGASQAVGYYSTPSQYSHQSIAQMEDPLRPLVSQVDELLNSVGRAISR